MKRTFKALAFFVLPSLIIVAFYSFKKYEEVKTKVAILKDFLYDGYCVRIIEHYPASLSDKSWMADSSYYLQKEENGYLYNYSPIECESGSPRYFINHIEGAIELKETGYLKKNNFEKSFKAIYKRDIRKKPIVQTAFSNASYSVDAIQIAFDKTYPKPTEFVDGFLMQKVYDLSFKPYARACAYVIADVMQNKTVFMQQVNLYKSKAIFAKWKDGKEFCSKAANMVLGKNYLDKQANETTKKYLSFYYDRIVGMMMRRQIDGTLPVIMNCIKTVLKDYDPTFNETIKTKL